MEKLRSEVFLECGPNGMTRIDVFSHVKNLWVYNSIINTGDLMFLLDDLMIKPDSTIVHLSGEHPLWSTIKGKSFTTNEFNGLSGSYKTSDDSIYELAYQPIKSTRPQRELTAKCIESETKSKTGFVIDPNNVERNIRHLLWTKIE